MLPCLLHAQQDEAEALKRWQELDALDWGSPQFHDSGKQDWKANWFLDGLRAEVRNSPEGMYFESGPVAFDNGSHAVLWTKDAFDGDIRIEYDYTRMDTIDRFVNIIYIQATGLGSERYPADIAEWSDKREIPRMSLYFRNMNLLHISYAAYGVEPVNEYDYIRVRRYPVAPGGNFAKDTAVPGDVEDTGLFKPGVKYHISIMKRGFELVMRVRDADGKVDRCFYWDYSAFPMITEGRIGLRQMWTRAARYGDFKVWTRQHEAVDRDIK